MPIYLELNLGFKRNKSNLSLHRNHISLNKVTISIQSDGKNKFDERRSFHPALISKTLEPYLEIYYSHISEYLIPFNQQSNLPTSNISPIRPKKNNTKCILHLWTTLQYSESFLVTNNYIQHFYRWKTVHDSNKLSYYFLLVHIIFIFSILNNEKRAVSPRFCSVMIIQICCLFRMLQVEYI